jgi:uncharacterized phage protein (TIGR02218 family)
VSGFLSGDVTSFAFCWRIERRDGVALGFTSHDRDLELEGFRYRSAPGISPSAIEAGDPLTGEAPDIGGALSSGSFTEDDLSAGRWDGARVKLFAADWRDPTQHVQIMRGELGPVTIERGRFSAELKGAGAAYDRPIVETTSPMCRAQFGDRRCRVGLSGYSALATIVSHSDQTIQIDRVEPVANGWGGGRVRWLDGPNAGLGIGILSSSGAELQLADAPAFEPVAGERVLIEEGCDKRFATCRGRFANADNFRGEPHLPGIDLLTRYPGE